MDYIPEQSKTHYKNHDFHNFHRLMADVEIQTLSGWTPKASFLIERVLLQQDRIWFDTVLWYASMTANILRLHEKRVAATRNAAVNLGFLRYQKGRRIARHQDGPGEYSVAIPDHVQGAEITLESLEANDDKLGALPRLCGRDKSQIRVETETGIYRFRRAILASEWDSKGTVHRGSCPDGLDAFKEVHADMRWLFEPVGYYLQRNARSWNHDGEPIRDWVTFAQCYSDQIATAGDVRECLADRDQSEVEQFINLAGSVGRLGMTAAEAKQRGSQYGSYQVLKRSIRDHFEYWQRNDAMCPNQEDREEDNAANGWFDPSSLGAS